MAVEGLTTKPRFYTTPPTKVRWPWILVNMSNYKREIKKAKYARHLIIDSGVDKFFFIERRTEYPAGFLDSFLERAKWLSQKHPNCWITIPDYPDDYEPGRIEDNVERTFQNIERFHRGDGVEWIYPAQSKFLDFDNFKKSLRRLSDFDPPRIGIGTVCKTNNVEFIRKCCEAARARFPNAWIHAFGPTLWALPFIRFYVNSFDSLSYTWYTRRKLSTGKRMPTSQDDKREAFRKWIHRMKEIVENPSLEDFI